MADDLDHLTERKAAEKVTNAKYQRGVRQLRERWEREGYDPMAHLRTIQGEGDAELLRAWRNHEQRHAPSLAGHLAVWEMIEVLNWARTRELNAQIRTIPTAQA